MTGHLKHFPQRNHAGRQSREQKGMIDRIKSQWNQNNKFPTMNGDSNIIVDPDESCLSAMVGVIGRLKLFTEAITVNVINKLQSHYFINDFW